MAPYLHSMAHAIWRDILALDMIQIKNWNKTLEIICEKHIQIMQKVKSKNAENIAIRGKLRATADEFE